MQYARLGPFRHYNFKIVRFPDDKKVEKCHFPTGTKYKILLVVAPAVFVLDQMTKWLIRSQLQMGEVIPVISGYFDIIHVTNRGAAFGMFSGTSSGFRVPFFYLVAVVALIIIITAFLKLNGDEKFLSLIFSLIIGGIAGNIVDRIFYGEVTDFLSVHIRDRTADFSAFGRHFNFALEWPAFNIADSAITVAMVLLVVSMFRPAGK